MDIKETVLTRMSRHAYPSPAHELATYKRMYRMELLQAIIVKAPIRRTKETLIAAAWLERHDYIIRS